MFKAEGIDAVVLKDAIDKTFISQLEQKNENVKFVRIDADLNDSFIYLTFFLLIRQLLAKRKKSNLLLMLII